VDPPPVAPTPAATNPTSGRERERTKSNNSGRTVALRDEGETFTKGEKSEPVPEPSASDDDFDKMFGGGKKKSAPPEDDGPKKKKEVYVPPAPGSGSEAPDSLSPADIMQVVVSNKPSIMKCVADQRAKDPDVTGTLVMRWTISTSGKPSNISVSPQSEEYKSTPMASCVSGLIKGWQFPKHKTQGDPINFPFKF
jgi:hypothetical protein